MNFAVKLKKIFLLLTFPRYWFTDSSYPFCKEFDEWVNQMLREGHVPKYQKNSESKIDFAGRTLWKYCYSCSDFTLHEWQCDNVRASRMTNIKLYKLLKENKTKKFYDWEKK